MTIQSRSANSIISFNLYTNRSDVYASDNLAAYWTSTSRNTTAQIVAGIEAFSIPIGSTINSVTVFVERRWSSGVSAYIDYAYTQIAYSTTLRGTQYNDTLYPTTDTLLSTDGGLWTVEELNSGSMRVYIDTDRKNTTVSTSHYIDHIYVEVDYTTSSQSEKILTATISLTGSVRRQTSEVKITSTKANGNIKRWVNRLISTTSYSVSGVEKGARRFIINLTLITGSLLARFNGYVLQRKDGEAGKWFDLARINASVGDYTDCFNLITGMIYYYRIKRVSLLLSDSEWSNVQAYEYSETPATQKELSAGIMILVTSRRQALRTLSEIVDISLSAKRMVTTSRGTAVSILSWYNRLSAQTLSEPVSTSGHAVNQTSKRLMMSNLIGTTAHRINAFLKGIVATTNALSTFFRTTYKRLMLKVTTNSTLTRSKELIKTLTFAILTVGQNISKTSKNMAGSSSVGILIERLKAFHKGIISTIHANETARRAISRLVSIIAQVTGEIKRTTARGLSQIIVGAVLALKKTNNTLTGVAVLWGLTGQVKVTLKSLLVATELNVLSRKAIQKTIHLFISLLDSGNKLIARHFNALVRKAVVPLKRMIKLITGVVQIDSLVSRMKVALKTLISTPQIASLLKKGIVSGLSVVIRTIVSEKKSISRYFSKLIYSETQDVRQTIKQIKKVSNMSGLAGRMKVALKTLVVTIELAVAPGKVVVKFLNLAAKTMASGKKRIVQILIDSIRAESGAFKRTAKQIIGSSSLRGLASRMKVALIVLITLIRTNGFSNKVIRKIFSSSLNSIVLVRQALSKVIHSAVVTASVIWRTVIREVQSDLATISSTYKSTALDIASALNAVMTGFSAWKVTHYIYEKSVSSAIATISLMNRLSRRVILVISYLLGGQRFARAKVSKSMRHVLLTTTGRLLSLELRSQEGSVISMAYTGDTIRLYGRFYGWSGELADVSEPRLKIYDGKGNPVLNGEPVKETIGVYYFEFTIPAAYSDPLIYEMSGLLDGTIILARATIERRWV